jgi:hypothetical protein
MLKILIVLVVIGSLGFWYWTTSPEYSIEQVKEAVKHHDLVSFKKYVDLDSVASGMVDDLLAAPMRSALGPGLFGQWLVAGIVGVFKAPLVNGVKEDLSHFVTTGQLIRPADQVGSGLAERRSRFSLGTLDTRLGFRKHAFRRIEYSSKDGKIATLGLRFHNQVYNQDLILEVKMEDCGGYWRLVELSNFPKFTGKLIELEASHLQDNSAESQQPARQI